MSAPVIDHREAQRQRRIARQPGADTLWGIALGLMIVAVLAWLA